MHITVLSKESLERWILVQKEEDPVVDPEANITCFGHGGDVGKSEVTTGQEICCHYLTEDELETYLDGYVSQPNYYKDSVENNSDKFIGISGKYIPNEPEIEVDPE